MFQFDDSVKVKQYHPYHKWNCIIISMRTREVMLSKGGIITNEKTNMVSILFLMFWKCMS